MSDTNSNLYPTAAAANGFPLVSSNGSFALETFRSFTSGLRRTLTSIVAQFSASSSIASDRLSYSPPPPPSRREGPLPPQDLALVDSEELIREILIRVGEDPDREGLQQTPARIIRSWKEIYGGYEQRSEEILVTQFCAGQYDEMVLLRDIEFYSTCEHHMLPFYERRIEESVHFMTRCRSANLETTRRRRAVLAAFFHGSINDLGEQRFGNETGVRMLAGRSRKWTAVAANEVFAFALVEAGCTTEIF
jgi:hypothetical protein